MLSKFVDNVACTWERPPVLRPLALALVCWNERYEIPWIYLVGEKGSSYKKMYNWELCEVCRFTYLWHLKSIHPTVLLILRVDTCDIHHCIQAGKQVAEQIYIWFTYWNACRIMILYKEYFYATKKKFNAHKNIGRTLNLSIWLHMI